MKILPKRKYPCRCNRRECQARRTLNKHPDDYVMKHHLICRVCGKGKLYIDWHRVNYGNTARDRGEDCKDDCLPYRHRKNNAKCKHNKEYKLKQSMTRDPKRVGNQMECDF